MDHYFDRLKFVCVDSPRGPKVLEIKVGTILSTVHPVSEYDTEEEAIVAARVIDPTWQPSPQGA